MALGTKATTTASAAESDYETVKVPEGELYKVTLGDGDTLENVLIDITADGATWEIKAVGSDWAVRNVGIKGVWDVEEDEEPFNVAVDEGSTAVIENFYFADGATDTTYPGVTGIYVKYYHAGTLKIDRTNIQDMAGNAIYASTPGYPEDDDPEGKTRPTGGQGVVEITNSYAENCVSSHFRIGTDGSFVKNCVGVGGDRGGWFRFNDTEVIDSDLSGTPKDIACGTNNWESTTDATVTVTNTVFDTVDTSMDYHGTVIGESADRSLRTEPPEGAPLTAKEAATGGSDDEPEPMDHTLTVQTAENTGWNGYTLTTTGEIVRDAAANDTDTITQNDDGTWTLEGVAGNGGTDNYRFNGDVTDWSTAFDSDEYRLTIDGETVSL